MSRLSHYRPMALLRRVRARLAGVRLAGDTRGAMAVEFALVALPLVFMIFSILELAMVFLVSSTLENATSDVARTIRTGAVQTGPSASNSAAAIRDAICTKLGWLQSSCSTNLSVDVRTYTQFANPSTPSPVTNNAFDSTKLTYSIGAQGDIVIVRAFYRWTLMTPFLKGGLSNLSGGIAMLTATSMFKNEPY